MCAQRDSNPGHERGRPRRYQLDHTTRWLKIEKFEHTQCRPGRSPDRAIKNCHMINSRTLRRRIHDFSNLIFETTDPDPLNFLYGFNRPSSTKTFCTLFSLEIPVFWNPAVFWISRNQSKEHTQENATKFL